MKHFKRAAAMLLAVVLSLCLAVTAFAEGTALTTGSLTVTGTGLTGKDYLSPETLKQVVIRMRKQGLLLTVDRGKYIRGDTMDGETD